MSENKAQPPAEDTTGKTTDSDQGDSEKELGDPGKKALIAEREARKEAERTAAQYKKQLDDAATAKMSDLDKAQTEAKTALERAEKAERDVLRYRIAAQHGINDSDADLFLTGSDEASMAAQAARYAELNQKPTTPRPDPSQGAKGESPKASPERDFLRSVMGR